MNPKTILRRLYERDAAESSKQLPTPHTVREPSSNERAATYQPPNTGILFCVHAKSYFEPCPSCKRTNGRAKENVERFIKKYA